MERFQGVGCAFGLAAVLLASAPLEAETEVHYRLLRADVETAASVRAALADSGTAPGRIDELVKGGRVKELAHLEQGIDGDSDQADLRANEAQFELPYGELMPLGVHLQGAVSVRNELAEIVLVYDNRTEGKRDRIAHEHAQFEAMLHLNRWELLHEWGEGDECDLLLARVSGNPGSGPTGAKPHRICEIHYRCELREVTKADLATFGRSTAATREKALRWLRDRSPLLASASGRMAPAGISVHEDRVEWVFERGGEWDTAQVGLTLEGHGVIGPEGRLVDFQLDGGWQPMTRRPSEEPEFGYHWGDTVVSGETVIVEPERGRASGRIPMLLVTPTVATIRPAEGKPRSNPGLLPPPGAMATRMYPVHPSLPRKLGSPKVGLQDGLAKKGLVFSGEASASLDYARCEVVLRHDRDGHAKFEQILKELEAEFEAAPTE